MANSIKVDGKTITYVTKAVTENTVTFSDGTVLTMIGSVANAAVLKAYQAAKASQSAPVIITKPSPGEPTLISGKDLTSLSDVEGVSFKVKDAILTDRCDWKNLKNVTIDFSGTQFQTGKSRAIQMNGNVNGLTLNNPSFKDISDYCIDFWGNGQVKYTGAAGSFIDGFTLINAKGENCGTLLHIDGGIVGGSQYGLIKNLIVKGFTFINSGNPGNSMYIGNGMDYDISGAWVDNINMSDPLANGNGAHNGIFQLNGNGKFYNNKGTNNQGQFVRAWLHSQEGTKTVEIFNNIYWNSKKYGAFELQVTPDMSANGYKPANAKIYNNIAGRLNNVKDFEGQMLDLYTTGGTLEYYNNTGIELFKVSGPITDMINYEGNTKVIRNDGNKYFATQAQALAAMPTLQTAVAGII